MGTGGTENSTGITVIRWTARSLGMLISGLFLFIFIGEAWESHSRHPDASAFGDINLIAAIGLGLMGVYIIAMFMALRWEHAGTIISVGALGTFFVIVFLGLFPGNVSGGFSLRGVLNPFLLVFWVPAILYLICWGLEERQRRSAGV